MNKYTLRFNQNELEVKYQNTRLEIRKQILYGVSSGFISMHFASIILKVVSSAEDNLIVDLLILAFAIFSVILATWNSNYIREGLTILNILQCSIQIDLSEQDTSQQMFLFGANIMATQIMLLFGSDFCYSVPQIAILFVSRITILNMHEKIDWFSVALTQIVSFWLCVFQYQCDQILRKQFLLTLKNHDWDSLLPQIIENPFFYFEFKDSQFQIKVSHNENQIIGYDSSYCKGCNLRKFLRNFLINNKTMEQFIIKKLNKFNELIQGKDLILKNKKGLEIIVNFSEIQDFTQHFIIIFKRVENRLRENNFQRSIQNFLIQYSRQLVRLMNKKFSYGEILKLNYQYISILYFKPKSVSQFLPLKVIQKIQYISGIFEIQCTKEPLVVFGFRNSFAIFWLQIALILIQLRTYCNKDLRPVIIIRKQQDDVTFKLSLENEGRFISEFKKNRILDLLKDKLFHYISYSQLIFKMYGNINLSFRELDY